MRYSMMIRQFMRTVSNGQISVISISILVFCLCGFGTFELLSPLILYSI